MGVRCVHRRALAVNFSPPTFELYRRFVRCVCGGGEEMGDGVAYQLHTQKTNGKVLKYF